MACRWRRCDGRRVGAGAFDQDLEAQRVLVLKQFVELARRHSYLLRLGIRRGGGALRGGEAECSSTCCMPQRDAPSWSQGASTSEKKHRIAPSNHLYAALAVLRLLQQLVRELAARKALATRYVSHFLAPDP